MEWLNIWNTEGVRWKKPSFSPVWSGLPAPLTLPTGAAYEWTENARWLNGNSHMSVHTLVFMTDNEKLPWWRCQPSTRCSLFWLKSRGTRLFLLVFLFCVSARFPLASEQVEQRLFAAMMTFVPRLCLKLRQSIAALVTHFLSPFFPPARDKIGKEEGWGWRVVLEMAFADKSWMMVACV